MRIVAVADTHSLEEDLGPIPEGDVFVHAGDLLRSGTLGELKVAVKWLRRLPHRHKVLVAGNHERCFVDDRDAALDLLGPEVTYLEDAGVEIGGLRFWGSPWQPEYGNWAFNLPRGAPLEEKWALIPKDTDVLVTHTPPLGFGDHTRVRVGCWDLLATVRQIQPALHLFGHIHQDGGFWRERNTCFANVTTWEGVRGATVIDVDPVMKVVTEVVVPPPWGRR